MISGLKKPHCGKKLREVRKLIDQSRVYSLVDSLSMLKSFSFSKFDETVEVVLMLGIDARHANQSVRGVVDLPASRGKNVKLAVICKEEQFNTAMSAGADIVSSTEIIDDIKNGKINFDICISTPDMMPLVSNVAKILGPKGLMPNPKVGTVTTDLTETIKSIKHGRIDFRNDKAGIIHVGIGKVSFIVDDLIVNIKALINSVLKAKPSSIKGSYLKAMYVSSTMGPSIKVDLSNIQ